jgi:dihydroneopterin aldolase
VGLKNLRIDCIVGIYPHEREAAQPLYLDVELHHDFADAAATEQIESAIDYDEVARTLTGLAAERKYQLLETFAEEGAAALFAEFDRVERVRIEIRKPNAVPTAAAAFVAVDRTRASTK